MAMEKVNASFTLLGLLLFLSGCFMGNECENFIREHETDIDIMGVIEDCYVGMNPHDRGDAVIILNGNKKMQTNLYSLVCYAQKGDTIIKKKGTLLYQVKRGNVVKDFYPECGNTTILDNGKTKYNPNFKNDCKERYKNN